MRFREYIGDTQQIVFLGLFIRLIFSPITGHPFDLPIWMQTGQLLSEGISPYSPYNHLGQTLLWGVWTTFAYLLSQSVPLLEPFFYIFLIKLLPIGADLVVTYLIIALVDDQVGSIELEDVKLYTFVLFLNPVFIFASSFWAMVDSLALICILMAYRYIKEEHLIRSATFLTIAIALKLYPVILLPAMFFYILIEHQSPRSAIGYFIYTVMLFLIIVFLPFLFLPWDVSEVSGTLISQTYRNFGGVTTLGVLAVSIEIIYIGKYLTLVNSELSSYGFIRFFWFFASQILSLFILVQHMLHERQLFKKDTNPLLQLIIIYYTLWVITATWVSEQNFVPLLGLISMYIFINREQGQLDNWLWTLLWLLTTLVTSHIILNVPFTSFFYPIVDNIVIIREHSHFMQVRAIFLTLFVLATSITISYTFYRFISHFFNKTMVDC